MRSSEYQRIIFGFSAVLHCAGEHQFTVILSRLTNRPFYKSPPSPEAAEIFSWLPKGYLSITSCEFSSSLDQLCHTAVSTVVQPELCFQHFTTEMLHLITTMSLFRCVLKS